MNVEMKIENERRSDPTDPTSDPTDPKNERRSEPTFTIQNLETTLRDETRKAA